MRRLRLILFWTHLVAGVVAGAVVLIMSVTGVLLTYQKQMTLWADLRGVEAGPPSSGAAALSADSLVRLVASRSKKTPTAVIWRNGASMPVEVQFGRDGRQYVSVYTGAVVGTGSAGMRKVFSVATDWHRWLAMTDDARKTGRAITGWSNVAFLVLVLTGMVLWWPRNLTWTSLRSVLWFRRGETAKARDFNWHNVIGIWSALPLAAIVASGAVISFPWASDLVYRVVGEAPPPRAPEGGSAPRTAEGGAGGRERPSAPMAGRTTDNAPLVGDVPTLAAARMSDWRTVSLAWPKSTEAPLVYTIDRGMGGEPTKRATLTISRTGERTKWQPFDSLSTGRRARNVMRFTHTGEVLGFWGQTLAGLVSLGAAVLVYTGLLLSLRRLLAWRRRVARATASPQPDALRA
ncbi:PepSY-associated TM helix domain-containing protein [Gemmatimonas sp.]|uniref:PepSY-associated TM helix domain-containing protein n=1 Tax=Gemmatimonas sp. TaxID=1962908 RepID=UPI003F6F3FE9